tara:strand:+ start:724 stop:948 length:225 start_codon:yes stop_codon:yes gene_type:complete
VSFEKVENGKFKKIVTRTVRERKSGEIKKIKDPPEEALYEITKGDDYDETMSFHDIDGTENILKFKLILEDEET